MIESVGELEQALGVLLSGCAASNRVNVLDVPGVRETLAETHREMAAERLEDGEAPGSPYWELVMADWSPEEDALFVLAMWRADALSLCAGVGPRAAILDICGQFTMAEVDELTSAMDARFRLSESAIRAPRGLAEYWMAT